MSASGGDKSELRTVGTDILMVRGYDAADDTMVLSVPPGITPRRVSVDAIEHWMIYSEHPEVGAILHVHGWIDGTASTEVNYPCGTVQLGSAVADLVRQAPDPSRAVVGLRNHGLTITGHDLDEIFARVGDDIVPRVPMS
jgi:ribulose-5-phosphate 4-epimerase/fuculose-1-phosphate aldolase